MKKVIKLIFLVYAFIFSIEIIKRTSLFLAPNIKSFLVEGLTPLKAVAVGWFTTSIVQSSSAVGSIAAAFAGNNLLTLQKAVFILIGASIGTSITALAISLITVAKKRRDFRHGFEIGLCYVIYGIFIGAIVFFLEYFFKVFSRLSLSITPTISEKISFLRLPNFVEIITAPIIDFLFVNGNKFLLMGLAILILIFTLKYLGKAMIEVLGGEEKARKFVNKHFDSKYKTYLIGTIMTAIVFSSSITIGLLVPLAVARLINLKKAIPFILGARLGTSTDIFLASIILGNPTAMAVAIAYFLFGFMGTLIFLPNTDFLFNVTKYSSKKLIHISRKKAFYVLMAFVLIPLAMVIFT
ncbi:Na/Pi cotransporter family protein [Candidatus Pacearchaeota archaeon]|nr:Na/Pi cotransporter family protein [Candidatus Pacearchaeota archaeon]